MASEPDPAPREEVVVIRRQPLWVRILKWIGIALLVLALLVAALLAWLNTGSGKRFIAHQLDNYTTTSGINVHVGKVTGSIYGKMVLNDVAVKDLKGVFLTAPEIDIDWRPFAYIHSKIDLRSVYAPTVRMLRNPALKPSANPNAPLIPNIDLSLGHFRIDRFILEPPVTGKPAILQMQGSAQILNGRAQIALDAHAISAPGVAGGDALRVRLDAVPQQNRLLIDLHLRAPVGGVVDSYAHLGRPLAIDVDGHGDWQNWQGRARAAIGGTPLLSIGLTAQNGVFHATGGLDPKMFLSPSMAGLVAPYIALDATATEQNRVVQLRMAAHSDALALTAAGGFNLDNSNLQDFRINARLLRPAAVMANVSGRNVALAAVVNGSYTQPTIDYRISADAIAYGKMGIDGLLAQGRIVEQGAKILVPVHATATRVTGLSASVGGLLTHVRADGTFAYSNGQIFSDDLHVRSDSLDTTMQVLADLKTGKYTAAVNGRVNNYLINGLGRVDISTDAHVVTAPSGGFGITGRVRIVTRQITNSTIASQFGGNAIITADIGYDPKGAATLRNIQLSAPDFHISGGSASYNTASGAFVLNAQGSSKSYGPFAVVGSGTLANPNIAIKLAHPNLGIGLANLSATIKGAGKGGYAVHATGTSDYGPFTADLVVHTGPPLSVEITRLLIAGITVSGHVQATAAGPYAGQLSITGSGLNGTVALGAAGSTQRADLHLTARDARIPGKTPITIGSGLVNASVLLPKGGSLSANGSAAVTDLRYGTTLVRSARAQVQYNGGRGRVGLTAAGSSGVPFSIAAQAAFTPDRIVANLQGSADTIPFHLAQPAVVTKQGADYVLAPVTIVLPKGSATIAGRYGATSQLHMTLNALDLSIADALYPTLGLAGRASGTLDATLPSGGALPIAYGRIDLNGFTRTGAMTVSEPVDIATLLRVSPAGAQAAALIRRNGETVGRLQARLAPIPAGGGSAMARLMAAPLAGGIRYNGPADVLWTLGGFAGQTLSGAIAVGADFHGTLTNPSLVGVMRANDLRYENETYGTTITGIQLDGRFTQSTFQLNRFTGKAGSGTIQANGSVGFAPGSGYPIAITAQMDNAQLARSDSLGATVSGTLKVTNGKGGGAITGDLTLPRANYTITRQGAADIPTLTGVRRKGAPPPQPTSAQGPAPSNWKLDIRIRADNQIFVRGMGLDSEWSTNMHVTGTTGDPQVVGRLQVVRGTFSFAGRRLTLADTSTVTFNGPLTQPELNISATTNVQGTDVGIAITGSATQPQIALTSTPQLPQDEILSLLLFGGPAASLSPTQALQLAAALNGLRGGGGGLDPIAKIRGATGLNELSILGADKTSGRGTALEAGKYLTNNIYVQVITDAKGFTQTQLTIALTRALSVLSQVGMGATGESFSLRYSKTY